MMFYINESPTDLDKKAELVINAWNKYADLYRFKKIRSTQIRMIAIKKYINNGFTYKDFRDGLRMLRKCAYLADSKWFNFDWLIKNDTNLSKFLEGNYVNCYKTIQYNGNSNVKSNTFSF